MTKTIVVCGFGPGISDAVARKFGKEGFQVALVARNAANVERGAAALRESGIEAKGFPCDLGDLDAVKRLIGEVRSALGPITVLHWNAYASKAGDLTNVLPEDLRTMFDVGVTGVVVALQESLPDLRAQKGTAAVLFTGGGLGQGDARVDAMAVQWGAMGLGLQKAAQHKLAGLLSAKLSPEGIYVGEVMVLGAVKGTAFDKGQPGMLEASRIADRFWEIYQGRTELCVQVAS